MTRKRFEKLLMSIGVPRDAAGEVAAIVPRHLSARGGDYEGCWLLYLDAFENEEARDLIVLLLSVVDAQGELDKFHRFAVKVVEANKIARTEPGRKGV